MDMLINKLHMYNYEIHEIELNKFLDKKYSTIIQYNINNENFNDILKYHKLLIDSNNSHQIIVINEDAYENILTNEIIDYIQTIIKFSSDATNKGYIIILNYNKQYTTTIINMVNYYINNKNYKSLNDKIINYIVKNMINPDEDSEFVEILNNDDLLYANINNEKYIDNPSDNPFSNIKGDVPFEYININNNQTLRLEYLDENYKMTNKHGRYTAKYLKKTVTDENNKVLYEELVINPNYDPDAYNKNNEWTPSTTYQDLFDNALQLVHKGLSLDEIEEELLNDNEYNVVLAIPDEQPVFIPLLTFKDEVLKLISKSNTLSEVVFNLMMGIE